MEAVKLRIGQYEFEGRLGCIFKSFECGRVPGDLRIIAKELFVVSYVFPRNFFKKPQVGWVFVDDTQNKPDIIREFKENLVK